jgi:hypothetical protein
LIGGNTWKWHRATVDPMSDSGLTKPYRKLANFVPVGAEKISAYTQGFKQVNIFA